MATGFDRAAELFPFAFLSELEDMTDDEETEDYDLSEEEDPYNMDDYDYLLAMKMREDTDDR